MMGLIGSVPTEFNLPFFHLIYIINEFMKMLFIFTYIRKLDWTREKNEIV